MSHDHHHHHYDAGRNLGVAFALNLAFTVIEAGGGVWTNSIAILADALHDAGDCFSLGLAWYLQRLSQKTADARFTYGYRRFSTLGALMTGVVLVVGLSIVGWSAIGRLQDPKPVRAPGMLVMAVIGILFNGAAAWMLRGGRSLNERVASWHLLEDVLGWAAVLIGSLVMMFWNAPIVDPLLALAISVFILWNVVQNLRRVAHVFLQGAPAGFDAAALEAKLTEISGVVGAHHTHTWTLDGESHVLTTHLVMQSGSTREEVVAAKRRVHELLAGRDFMHVTVDVELEGEQCASSGGCGHTHDEAPHNSPNAE